MKPQLAHEPRHVSLWLIGALVVVWLLLNDTLAPGQILLGALLAFALAWVARNLRPLRARAHRLHVAVVLPFLFLADIVRSNYNVARVVLGLRRDFKSGYVRIPLTIRDPHGVAVIAVIVTSTPGTVWVDLAPDGSVLTLHVLDLRDEADWIDWLKNRYERRLMEIFE